MERKAYDYAKMFSKLYPGSLENHSFLCYLAGFEGCKDMIAKDIYNAYVKTLYLGEEETQENQSGAV